MRECLTCVHASKFLDNDCLEFEVVGVVFLENEHDVLMCVDLRMPTQGEDGGKVAGVEP